jgi:signal transduction histidine kinase
MRQNKKNKLPATVREAVQKRITPKDRSSIIPGIDVNELKHSLDLLKYALDYSEAIVDTVRMPLIVLDKKLRVLTANRSFYKTFRALPKKIEGQLIYRLNNHAWNIPRLRLLLEKILPKNTHFENYEVEINLPHIGLKTMMLSARRTYRQVNNTEAILLAFEDITNRKLLEKQKDDFIGIVSHELRTPLTGISLYSQLLEKQLKGSKDKKGLQFLSKMTQQMARLTQLTASFVNVYKIQTGQLKLNKSRFGMDELIRSVVSDFQHATKSHVIISKSEAKMNVYADRERMAQVLINLISNAIKYSPKSDKVIIKSSQNAQKVTVSVQDFGLGIPKEERSRIFERFFRAKGKGAGDVAGLGLGLYISFEIVKQHKGKMWVESTDGKGSTFYFSLPLR